MSAFPNGMIAADGCLRLPQVVTTALTDTQIDGALGHPVADGEIVLDPINVLLLLRVGGVWQRFAARGELLDTVLALWTTLPDSARGGNAGSSSGQRVLLLDGVATPNSGNAGPGILYVDTAEEAVTGRTTTMRMRVAASGNAVDPGCDITIGLYAVTSTGGATNLKLNLAASPIATVVFTDAEMGASFNQIRYAEFDAPTAGRYVFVSSASATPTTNTVIQARCCVQARRV